MAVTKIGRAIGRKAALLFRLLRYPEQVWDVVDARTEAKVTALLEALKNRSEGDLAPLIDPETGAIFDYPSTGRLAKSQVADALTLAVDYISASRVPGEIAEFGIGSGWTSSILAKNMRTDDPRRLHLFDSFEGLPAASQVDQQSPMVKDGIWVEGSCNWRTSPEILSRILKACAPNSQVAIYKGWFSETMPEIPPNCTFALVHLDCDLYQSTREVLFFLFSRRLLSEGAILLFDDWNCNRCSPDFGQQRAWREATAEFGIRYMDYGFYSHSGKRFIYQGCV